jgi:hypothetical protein
MEQKLDAISVELAGISPCRRGLLRMARQRWDSNLIRSTINSVSGHFAAKEGYKVG